MSETTIAELAVSGERFNLAAWSLVKELMGCDAWSVSDTDQSQWAIKMRAFCIASDEHRAALKKQGIEAGQMP